MRKSCPFISSSPRLYCVVPQGQKAEIPLSGKVETPAGTISLRFFHDEETVHSISTTKHSIVREELLWGVEAMENGGNTSVSPADLPSFLAREALIRRLSKCRGYKDTHMEIRRFKDSRGLGPPKLFINGKHSAVDISLSHDGRFIAYAFSLINFFAES